MAIDDTSSLLTPTSLPDENPSASLSYEKDIVPMKQQYFTQMMSNTNIDPVTAAGYSINMSQNLDNVYIQQAKLAEAEQMGKNRDLQYQSALFTLNSERDKALKNKQDLEGLGAVTAELNAISAETDPDVAVKSLGQWGLNNAGKLQSKVVATAYDAARLSIITPKKKAFDDRDLMTIGVDFNKLDTNKDGVVSDDERDPMKVNRVLIDTKKEEKTGLLAAKQLEQQERAADTLHNQLIPSMAKELTSVKFGKDQMDQPTGAFADSSEEGKVTQSFTVLQEFVPTEQVQKFYANGTTDAEKHKIALLASSNALSSLKNRSRLATPAKPAKPNAASHF